MKRILSAFVVAAAFALCAQSAPIPAITLLPGNGNVGGPPGATVGWGFILTYTAPADWVVLTGSQFVGSPIYGTYVDYLSLSNAPLYVAGPSPESLTVQEAWNSKSNPLLGLGEFDIDRTAVYGAISGDIVVHYSVFSQDPNSPTFDPDTSTVVADATLSVPVSVNVTPEPASLLLTISAFLLFTLAAGCRRSSNEPGRKFPRSRQTEPGERT